MYVLYAGLGADECRSEVLTGPAVRAAVVLGELERLVRTPVLVGQHQNHALHVTCGGQDTDVTHVTYSVTSQHIADATDINTAPPVLVGTSLM